MEDAIMDAAITTVVIERLASITSPAIKMESPDSECAVLWPSELFFKEVKAEAALIGRWLNSSLPVEKLPTELIVDILRLAIVLDPIGDGMDRYSLIRLKSLSRVCRRWRHIAHSTPDFWSKISIGQPDYLVQEAFQRSGMCPLTLTVPPELDSPFHCYLYDSYRSLAAKNVRRWKSIDLRILDPPNCLERWRVTLESPAPLIEDLRLGYIPTETQLEKPFNLFSSEAPKLKRLLLHYIAIEWTSSIISQLTRLELWIGPHQTTPSAQQLAFIFANGLCLEELSIKLRYDIDEGEREEKAPATTQIELPRLHSVEICGPTTWLHPFYLMNVQAPICTHFWFECDGEGPTTVLLEPLRAFTLSHQTFMRTVKLVEFAYNDEDFQVSFGVKDGPQVFTMQVSSSDHVLALRHIPHILLSACPPDVEVHLELEDVDMMDMHIQLSFQYFSATRMTLLGATPPYVDKFLRSLKLAWTNNTTFAQFLDKQVPTIPHFSPDRRPPCDYSKMTVELANAPETPQDITLLSPDACHNGLSPNYHWTIDHTDKIEKAAADNLTHDWDWSIMKDALKRDIYQAIASLLGIQKAKDDMHRLNSDATLVDMSRPPMDPMESPPIAVSPTELEHRPSTLHGLVIPPFPQRPNNNKVLPSRMVLEEVNEEMERIFGMINEFEDHPPFTIQRVCELIRKPTTYSSLGKYLRALERTLLITSTADQYTADTYNVPTPTSPYGDHLAAVALRTASTPMFSPIPFLHPDMDPLTGQPTNSPNGAHTNHSNMGFDRSAPSPLMLNDDIPPPSPRLGLVDELDDPSADNNHLADHPQALSSTTNLRGTTNRVVDMDDVDMDEADLFGPSMELGFTPAANFGPTVTGSLSDRFVRSSTPEPEAGRAFFERDRAERIAHGRDGRTRPFVEDSAGEEQTGQDGMEQDPGTTASPS